MSGTNPKRCLGREGGRGRERVRDRARERETERERGGAVGGDERWGVAEERDGETRG